MSLNMRLGARGNILQPGADAYRQLTLSSPVLLETDLSAIQEQDLVATKVCRNHKLCLQGCTSLLSRHTTARTAS